MKIHISFVPEVLFKVGDFAVTNSLLTAALAVLVVIILLIISRLRFNALKPTTTEVVLEMVYDALNGLTENILGKESAKKFFGFLFTFFIFVLASNWTGLLPFVPAVGVVKEHHETEEVVHKQIAKDSNVVASSEVILSDNSHEEEHSEEIADAGCILKGECLVTTDGIKRDAEFTPLLRAPTADLSSTLTLALISVIVTNIVGIYYGRFGYIKKYFNFSDPISFIVGILEFFSEIGKIISFAFRLFGNIFAGEVLLAVITTITFGIVTLPLFIKI